MENNVIRVSMFYNISICDENNTVKFTPNFRTFRIAGQNFCGFRGLALIPPLTQKFDLTRRDGFSYKDQFPIPRHFTTVLKIIQLSEVEAK